MLQVLADPRWAQPCLAYNVHIPVRGDAVRAFREVQDQLRAGIPAVHLIPPESLHISLYGVIPVSWESDDKERHWRAVSTDAFHVLQRITERTPTFTLPFETLRVDRHAVIALAADTHPVLRQIRRELAEVVIRAGIPAPSYSIVHSTLARFSAPATLDAASVTQVQAYPLAVTVHANNVRLVRERVYPTLAFDVLADYPFRG